VIYNDYANEIEESSEIFQFAHYVANDCVLKENMRDSLVRINAIILTNGEYKSEIPASTEICGCKIFYDIVDINYLFRIEQSGVPIEIDFENLDDKSFRIPCLSADTNTPDYKAYIAIIPGLCLNILYEKYHARLLEQNVRSFLQFSGKINKGIRETIKTEPQMFLAYNNGIAATADNIELDETNHFIKKISNLQIVNGGQTTASIFYTLKKDKADISKIFVQMKLSVIDKKEEFAKIVSKISRCANTQNKVNDADFSANNASLIEFEKLSRTILTPITVNNNMKTYWFFERARGQYKTLRNKEGFNKSLQKKFDLKYPKNQMFTKVELAKYINAYQEISEGKKLVIGPHIVVRRNEKNFDRFINYNLPDNIKHINSVYFEDTIAKCILFKTAEKRYGVGTQSFKIGEMRQVVVPYTLSLLNILTDNKLNLFKIWKNQSISNELSDYIYNFMVVLNDFIKENSPVSHYIEWAKKEDCWIKVKEQIQEIAATKHWCYKDKCFTVEHIKVDLTDETNPPKRNPTADTEISEEIRLHEDEIIRSIPFSLWKKIEQWGRDTGLFSIHCQSDASDIACKVKNNRKLTDQDRTKAMAMYEIVCQHNYELLEQAEELSAQDEATAETTQQTNSSSPSNGITLELIQKMVDWDRRKRVLEDWKWKVMDDVLQGRKPLDDRKKYTFFSEFGKTEKARIYRGIDYCFGVR
jgi:hypothetical protein